MTKKREKTQRQVFYEAVIKIVHKHLPSTRNGLYQFIPLSQESARRYIRKMHSENKIHVIDWVNGETGGTPQAVFAKGKGWNVEKPEYDNAATQRAYRAKVKARTTQIRTRWIGNRHPCEQYNPFSRIDV